MSITQKQASELASAGRLEQAKKNLTEIYEGIIADANIGKSSMKVDWIFPEVRKELLENGYIVHPNEGNDYENPAGQWTIYWGYSDDEKKDLFNDDDRKDAFS